MPIVESSRNNPLVPRGTSGAGEMGRGTRVPTSIGSASPDHLQGSRGVAEQGYWTGPAYLASHGATLAATLPGASAAWARKGPAAAGAYSPGFSPQDPSR